MNLSKQTKGILTVIGGLLVHLASGTMYSFGLLNPFFISYLNLYDNTLTLDDGFFLLPIGVLFMKLFIIVGGIVEANAGPRV
jgi:hypothetical protein